VRRDFLFLLSPPGRTERHTMMTGGVASRSTCDQVRARSSSVRTSEQRDDDVGVKRSALGGSQERVCLVVGQRFRRAALLTLRHVAQEHHVALYLVPSLSARDGPPQNRMENLKRVGAQGLGFMGQPAVHRSATDTANGLRSRREQVDPYLKRPSKQRFTAAHLGRHGEPTDERQARGQA
jgi:hypothetical protein